jgi:hypothetical protein
MQTFDELEKKLLDEHHVEYKAFTRLLLSLTVASLTLLAALLPVVGSITTLSILCLLLLLASIASGIIVQHQIMMAPMQHLVSARAMSGAVESNEDEQPLKLRRQPSKLSQRFYKVQVFTFAVAFVFLSSYAFFGV